MKKFILIAGALLLAAVFMSGCVAEEDPVIGIWHNEEKITAPDGSVYDSEYLVFNAGGSGFYLLELPEGKVNFRLDFTWKNLGSGTYELTHADVKGTEIPEVLSVTLKDSAVLYQTPAGTLTFNRESVSGYMGGLWVSERGDYQGYDDIMVMLYFYDDGKGDLIVYTSAVTDREQTHSLAFTWTEKDSVVYVTGPQGNVFELLVKDGAIYVEDVKNPIHKYTAEDYLIAFWMSEEPCVEDGVSYDIVTMLKSDGTGIEFWTIPNTYKASFKYPFTWKLTSANTYQAVYDDGEVWIFAYDQIALKLDDGETEYRKVSFESMRNFLDK